MILQYPIFYRLFGVRRAAQLAFPRVNGIDVFHFPRNSLYHFISADPDITDPNPEDIYFQGYTRRFLIDYIKDLAQTQGHPRHRGLNLMTMIRPFLHAHKQFRYVRDAHKFNDINTLVVYNYSYINKFYIYNKTNMTHFHKWHNLQDTILKRVKTIAEESERNQFLFFEVDTILPSYSSFKIFAKKTNLTMLKVFNSDTKLFLLEIFKWLGHDDIRQTSMLSALEQADYSKINIVLTCKGKWITFNLDYLDQWRLSSTREKIPGMIAYNPDIIQKLFIKLLLSLVSHSTVLEQDKEIKDEENSNPATQEVADTAKDDKDLLEHSDPTDPDSEDGIIEANTLLPMAQKNRLLNQVTNHSSKVEHKPQVMISAPAEISDDHIDNFNHDMIDLELSNIDQELAELDNMEKQRLGDQGIVIDKEGEIKEIVTHEPKKTFEEVHKNAFTPTPEEHMLQKTLDEYADFGIMSASDYRSVKKAIEQSKALLDPYQSKQPLSKAKVIHPDETVISKERKVLVSTDNLEDHSMVNSSIHVFDKLYIENILKKDILGAVAAVQKSGIIVENYDIEHDHSVLGDFEYHTVKLRPIDGKSSVVRFKLPKINSDGSFMKNNVRYVMRKQRVDLPIRKIKPTIVALSSYYGKTFIERSLFQRTTPQEWIAKQINLAVESETGSIQKVYPADVYDNYFTAPYLYNALATKFKGIILKDIVLDFDHHFREKAFIPEVIEQAEVNHARICGVTKNKDPVVMSDSGNLYVYKDKKFEELGSFYSILGLDEQNSPLDYCSARIFSKMIPVAFILSYLIGFDNLLTLLKSKHRIVEGSRAGTLEKDEWSLKFKDSIYIFNRKDYLSTLVLSGFLVYKDLIKTYEPGLFNKKEVFFNILDELSIGSIYLKEVDNMKNMFVDPITKEILMEMHEPVTFEGLLVKSAEMLMNFNHNDFQDMSSMRIRGYERMAGAVYKELAHAIRQYNSKSIRGKGQIELNPYAIWKTITDDPAIKMVEETNPIQDLKEHESVTYVGEGGRNRETLSRDTRAYHQNDMGVVSEATVDSGDVGINAYLSANSQLGTVRGLIDHATKEISNASLLSTSALLSAGSDHDSPQRVNFVSIQQSHSISCDGYHQPYVQTGYEQVMPYRASALFAYMAEHDGIVEKIDNNAIVVLYKTDQTGGKYTIPKGVYLGRKYGKAEGSVYPHDIITDLKVGQKFSKGDPIAYNKGFFERDFYDPRKIIYKGSMNAKTALYETSQTLEDSSSISKKISERMSANTTKIKTYTLDFKQNIRKLVKVGSMVKPDTVLFIIEDEATGGTDIFSDVTVDTLKRISALAPRAKLEGILDKIEVFYHGDKEDMSPSLRQLANYSDRLLKEQAVSKGDPVITGMVNNDYRVEGKALLLDTLEIKLYITRHTKASIGDKGVFANQMKTVFGEVIDYNMSTETGEEIDAVFGYRSIAARVVLSPTIIGTTTTLLKLIAKKAINIYEG